VAVVQRNVGILVSSSFGFLSSVHGFICQQELIQNADDARATEVVFIHDERSYGTESLWTDDLAKYQGM